MASAYQDLVDAVIRPPRAFYDIKDLGPREFSFFGRPYCRVDSTLTTARGLTLECSHWGPYEAVNLKALAGIVVDDNDRERTTFERPETKTTPDNDTEQQNKAAEEQEEEQEDNDDKVAKDNAAIYSQHLQEEQEMMEQEGSSQQSPLPESELQEQEQQEQQQQQQQHSQTRQQATPQFPAVIFMHGNSSARLEVLPQLTQLLALGVTVVAFDFTGSGHSQGQHVSLGYYESRDLQTVVAHLRSPQSAFPISTMALWGRSMGASTALLYAGNPDNDPSTIAGMILDSPFADLPQLFREMVERVKTKRKTNTACTLLSPMNLMLSLALRVISRSIQKQAGFLPKHVSPIQWAPKCFMPALFVAAQEDALIAPETHARPLHNAYGGDKNLIILEHCDHNAPRPQFLLDSACFFLRECLQLEENHGTGQEHPQSTTTATQQQHASLSLADVIPVDMDLGHLPWMYHQAHEASGDIYSQNVMDDRYHYFQRNPDFILPQDMQLQDITNLEQQQFRSFETAANTPEQPRIIDSYAPEQSHGPLRIVGISQDDEEATNDNGDDEHVNKNGNGNQRIFFSDSNDDNEEEYPIDGDEQPDLLQAQQILSQGTSSKSYHSADPEARHADDEANENDNAVIQSNSGVDPEGDDNHSGTRVAQEQPQQLQQEPPLHNQHDPPPDMETPPPPSETGAPSTLSQSAYDHETMGMTAARQRDIESNLLRMVGGGGQRQ